MANKPINQIDQTAELENDSLLIAEMTDGTKVIKFEDLAKAVKKIIGKDVNVVDTLDITEKGNVSEGYLVSEALEDKQAQIRAAYGYFGKEIEFTWAELKTKTAAGDFSGINIGDYKDVTLSNGEKVRMEVAGIDTYIGHQSNNNHRIYWISRDCLKTTYAMNDTNTNTGGFPASKLKTTLNTTIFNMLPAEVQAVIVADKRLCSTKGSWEWKEDQKLWLPSEVEVWGFNSWSEVGYGNGCGIQFPIFAGSLRHICKGLGFGAAATGSRCGWWCDSPCASSTTNFCYVSTVGLANNNYASSALGVPVCFTT